MNLIRNPVWETLTSLFLSTSDHERMKFVFETEIRWGSDDEMDSLIILLGCFDFAIEKPMAKK